MSKEKIFKFCRKTAYNIVKKVFPDRYPHYFRLNRITKILERFGAVTVQNVIGINMNSINAYVGKIDIKRVGDALREEIG